MNIEDQILYEDKDILVCKKEAGMAVQTARGSQMDLESALKNYLARKTDGKSSIYLAVIHRLDQPVRGILVFAKTKEAAKGLNQQLTAHTMGKYYLATVDGTIPNEEDILIDYLLKDGKTNTSKVVNEGTPGAKKAELAYKKESDNQVEITLKTGRHHQIRVQLAHHGMPLVGDTKYNPNATYGTPLGLCAHKLTFIHPITKKPMEFFYQKKQQSN